MVDDHRPADPAPYPGSSRSDDDNIEPLLLRWDLDIKRAASAAARRRMLDRARPEDLAQEARLRILRLARRGGPCAEPYIRTVIANTVREAARREARVLEHLLLADDVGDKQGSEDIAEASSESIACVTDSVSTWIRGLSARLQTIYDLLYVRGHTQREAAAIIGITQPRIAQLHTELVRRGRLDLAEFAA